MWVDENTRLDVFMPIYFIGYDQPSAAHRCIRNYTGKYRPDNKDS